jgi:hypothetical protein
VSGGETGVYGRMTGLPFGSFRASGSEAFTTRQEATGRREASLLGNSKTKLSNQSAKSEKNPRRKRKTVMYCGCKEGSS